MVERTRQSRSTEMRHVAWLKHWSVRKVKPMYATEQIIHTHAFTATTGNFRRDEASDFLRGFSEVLRPGDSMIIGVDACSDPAKV